MVLASQLCSADEECHVGALALDASHFTYLGRGALHSTAGDSDAASILLAQILRATACWNPTRLCTTAMIADDQVDQQLGFLGLAPPTQPRWNDFVTTLGNAPVGAIQGAGQGQHDDELLNRVAEVSIHHPTWLVTNDEDLLERAQKRAFGAEDGRFAAMNSTPLMIRLLKCGALPADLVEACLVAEHQNLDYMRQEAGLGERKYQLKLERLERAQKQLVLHQLGP